MKKWATNVAEIHDKENGTFKDFSLDDHYYTIHKDIQSTTETENQMEDIYYTAEPLVEFDSPIDQTKLHMSEELDLLQESHIWIRGYTTRFRWQDRLVIKENHLESLER